MMLNDGAALKWLVLMGLVLSFALWAFRIIPWWGILIGGVAAPFVALGGFIILGLLAWMASGSH